MSYKAALLDWLDALSPGWFWARDMPGPGSTARPILSRLANDPASRIVRIAHGFYYKTPPHEGHKIVRYPSPTLSALIYAGPGSGLSGFQALNSFNWTTQLSAKEDVVALRRIKPFAPYIRYTRHPNELRGQLTWTEVTMLEALEFIQHIGPSWHRCMQDIPDGTAAARRPWGHIEPFAFRRDLMLAAVEREPVCWHGNPRMPINRSDLRHHINDLCDATSGCVPA